MPNKLYDKAREGFLNGEISWKKNNIKVVLLNTENYTVSFNADQFLYDIPKQARIAVSSDLTGKTTRTGVADADNVIFTELAGDTADALAIYVDSKDERTSRLIAYIDTINGLPVIPNEHSDIEIFWDNSPLRIFKL